MQFNKLTIKALRFEIDNALKAIGEKHGISIQTGNAKFSENDVVFKLRAANISADGTAVTREAEDFKVLASVFGLEPTDLGKPFTFQGNVYSIAGIRSRARSMPIIARRDGKSYKFAAESVIRALGRTVAK